MSPSAVRAGRSILAQLAEKVVATFLQAFVAALVVADTLGADAAQAAALAAAAAALTALANGLPVVPAGLPLHVDLALRVLRTSAATFIGFVATIPLLDLDQSALAAAFAAALTAGMAVLKGGLGSLVGDPATAALLPRSLDTTAEVR